MKTSEFIQKHQLEIATLPIFQNPHQPKWDADHYQVKITQVGKGHPKSMVLFFSKGFGHRKGRLPTKPSLIEVINCLKVDVSTLDYNFEEWCESLGMDSDSLTSLQTYKAQTETAKSLRHLLGRDGLNELINEVEEE